MYRTLNVGHNAYFNYNIFRMERNHCEYCKNQAWRLPDANHTDQCGRVANHCEYLYALWINLTDTLLKYQNNTKTFLQENSYRF